MDSLIIELLLAFIMLPVIIFSMFIPYLTRKTESFGVSIPERIFYHENLKRMRKKYAVITGIIGLGSATAYIALDAILHLTPDASGIGWSLLLFLYIILSFLVYLHFHRDMKRMKTEEKWFQQAPQRIVVDTKFRNEKLVHSNGWFAIPLFITFLTMILTFVFYDKIPEKIPMQYNFSGKITNWADKSFRTIILMPVMQLYLTFLFLFINIVISKAKQQLNVENPEKSRQQNILFRRRWSAFMIAMGTGLIMLFSFVQLSFIFPINPQVLSIILLIYTMVVLIGTFFLAVKTGQGGSRIRAAEGKNGKVINRDDDAHWKLGQFYFNKEDPALFLEKRFGVGWTINFARPLAWIIFLSIILLAFAIPFLLS